MHAIEVKLKVFPIVVGLLFIVATVHALLMLAEEKWLHRGVLPPFLRTLPPLLEMEALLFRIVLGAFILLLFVGSQILSWYWVFLIPAAAILAGLYRARRLLPSAYGVAQIVDHRMALAATILAGSTAGSTCAGVQPVSFMKSVIIRSASPRAVSRCTSELSGSSAPACDSVSERNGACRSSSSSR